MNSSPTMPPCIAYALKAHSKSAMAPTESSCANSGASMSPAGILLAGSTSSALSHAIGTAIIASIAAVTVPRAFRFSVDIVDRSRIEGLEGMRSPPEIDAEHPLRELRCAVLLPASEVPAARPAQKHGFRLEPRVIGPRDEVATGERDHGPVEPRPAQVDLGERV